MPQDNYFGLLISNCRALLNSFRSVQFSHVKGDGNKVAHELANIVLNTPNSVWMEGAPETVCNLAVLDLLGPH